MPHYSMHPDRMSASANSWPQLLDDLAATVDELIRTQVELAANTN